MTLIKLLTLLILIGPSVAMANGFSWADGRSLRLMSYNIRYDEPRDGVNAWTNRKAKVADVIRFHKADLAGLQEALIEQIEDLEKLLPGMAWCGVGRTDGKRAGEFSPILFRKERLELKECKTFWLSGTPDSAGSKGWDAALPRIVTWARFRDRVTGVTFVHFNTHFDHVGVTARTESARLIAGRIKAATAKAPVVLTGDLNVREEAEAYRILSDSSSSGVRDARYASINPHFGGASTFNGFKEMVLGMRIDYIFVSARVTVVEHGILSDNWDGQWASDHLPVLAELRLR